jgi:hypothetical protein
LKGNVGIGTTTPTQKLDVAGNINFTGDLYDSGVLLDIGGKFADGTNPLNAVYTGGNVGIGTTSPTEKLEISGDNSALKIQSTGDATIYLQADTDNIGETDNPSIRMGQDGGGSDLFSIGISGDADQEFTGAIANAPYIHASNSNIQPFQIAHMGNVVATFNQGNVGIGTTAPTSKLHVDGGTNTDILVQSDDSGASSISLLGDGQGTGRVYVGQSTTHGGGIEYNGDNSPGTTGAGADYFALFRRTGGTEYWTARNFHNSNNWNFRGSLDVNLNITANGGHVYLGAAGAQDLYGDNDSALYFDSNNTTASRFILRDSDNDQYGSLYGSQGDNFGLLDGDGHWSYRAQKDVYTSFLINDSEKMRILANGNVEIGTASPGSKLIVSGDIEFSSTGTIKTTSGEVRCPAAQVMVGFNTSGIMCEAVDGATWQ